VPLYARVKTANILLRVALALACIVVMFHPNDNIAMVAVAFVLPAKIEIQVSHPPVINKVVSEKIAVGCGSAIAGLFAPLFAKAANYPKAT